MNNRKITVRALDLEYTILVDENTTADEVINAVKIKMQENNQNFEFLVDRELCLDIDDKFAWGQTLLNYDFIIKNKIEIILTSINKKDIVSNELFRLYQGAIPKTSDREIAVRSHQTYYKIPFDENTTAGQVINAMIENVKRNIPNFTSSIVGESCLLIGDKIAWGSVKLNCGAIKENKEIITLTSISSKKDFLSTSSDRVYDQSMITEITDTNQLAATTTFEKQQSPLIRNTLMPPPPSQQNDEIPTLLETPKL